MRLKYLFATEVFQDCETLRGLTKLSKVLLPERAIARNSLELLVHCPAISPLGKPNPSCGL